MKPLIIPRQGIKAASRTSPFRSPTDVFLSGPRGHTAHQKPKATGGQISSNAWPCVNLRGGSWSLIPYGKRHDTGSRSEKPWGPDAESNSRIEEQYVKLCCSLQAPRATGVRLSRRSALRTELERFAFFCRDQKDRKTRQRGRTMSWRRGPRTEVPPFENIKNRPRPYLQVFQKANLSKTFHQRGKVLRVRFNRFARF